MLVGNFSYKFVLGLVVGCFYCCVSFASNKSINTLNPQLSENIILSSGATAVIERPECKAKLAVLMIHGWMGNKDELGGLYKTLAQNLKAECIGSLRFDVTGEAEREKSNFTLTSTFSSRLQDSQSALDTLQAAYPNLPLVVVGFSLGGATAMELVSQHPDTFTGMVLWSSALNPSEVVTNPDYHQGVRQALEEGEGHLNLWEDLTLTRKHVVGMLGYNPVRNLNQFKGHLLAIRGTDDYLPKHEGVILDQSSAVTEDVYYLGGADHVFNVLDPKTSQKDKVLQLTLNWLNTLL